MLKNSHSSYGWIAIILHWLVALMIFGLFGLGLYMVELDYYDGWYKKAPDLHKSIGIVLLCLLVFRLIWRLINTRPAPLKSWNKLETKSSELVHWFLYLLMFATIVTGYLISTADGRGISVFGLFEMPALLPPQKGLEDIAGEIHEILAWCIIGFVILHFAGALKHQFWDKDNTIMRIVKPNKTNS